MTDPRVHKAEVLTAQMHNARTALAQLDPRMDRVHRVTPPLTWRLRTGGFEGLLRMIVEQQVSVAAAAAIWRRVGEGLGEITPERVLSLELDTLRTFGLSAPKARYAHEIAMAQHEGRIDFDHLEQLDDEQAVAALTAIKGVGRWTAETFLMFCEGRGDVFPAGDVALQEAWRWADRSEVRLKERDFYLVSQQWQPYRSVAAQLLWSWYGGVKSGEITLD